MHLSRIRHGSDTCFLGGRLAVAALGVSLALGVSPAGAWAAGGGTLVFSRVTANESSQGVWTVRGDGSRERPLGQRLYANPFWTAGGRRIAAALPRPLRFVSVSRSGRARQTLTVRLRNNARFGSHVTDFSLSPEGRRLAFGYVDVPESEEVDAEERYSTFVQPLGALERELPGTADRGLIGPVWSPDGGRLALRNGREVWLADPDGGTPPRLLADGIGMDTGWPNLAWSPEGTAIAVGGGRGRSGLSRVDVRSGAVRNLVPDPDRNVEHPLVLWSPNGKLIAYERRQFRVRPVIRVVNSSTGRLKLAIRPDRSRYSWGRFAWAPDSRQIAVSCDRYTCKRPQGIWAVSLNGRWKRLTRGIDYVGDWTAR
jgi:Tol biopolymer transport system component